MTATIPTILLPSSTILTLDHNQGKTLGDIAHLQSYVSSKQCRQDYLLPVRDVPLAFYPAADGGAVAVLDGQRVKVTKAAFRQLSQQLEVPGLGRMLEQTAKLDSTATWRGQEAKAFESANLLLRMWSQRVSRSMRWRVLNRRFGDEGVAVLDGVVTENYVPLAHTDALALAVDHFGADRSVIEYRLTTEEMRLRIADEPMELGRPLKMIEVWNSENGHRSLSFWGRLWKLICSNGMAATLEDYGRARYVHVGDMSQRVRDQLPGQLHNLRVAMGEGEAAYEQAERTLIEWESGSVIVKDDNPGRVETFIQQANTHRKTRMNDRQLQKVFDHGLRDETSSRYGTLAGAVDAITLVAQEEDLASQKLLEDIAFDVMMRGLRQRQGDLIPVTTAA